MINTHLAVHFTASRLRSLVDSAQTPKAYWDAIFLIIDVQCARIYRYVRVDGVAPFDDLFIFVSFLMPL